MHTCKQQVTSILFSFGSFCCCNNKYIHKREYQKRDICPQFPCNRPQHHEHCRTCGKCNSVCMDFEEEFCPRLQKSPFVCNGCKDEHKCVLHKKFYLHDCAEMDYMNILSESRSGANISELELKAVDAFLSPLLENGQSPHNVMLAYPDRFTFCEITLYRYIDANLISARNYDLPRRPSIQLFIKLQLISILCYTSTVERYNSNEQGKITVT